MPEYKLRPYLNYEKNMTNTQKNMVITENHAINSDKYVLLSSINIDL